MSARNWKRVAGAWVVSGAFLVATASEPPATPSDPVVDGLVKEALEKRPEAGRAKALVAASKQTVPQAGALPDPSLSVGMTNAGFTEITLGKMEMSNASLMLMQPFFWPGKQSLRTKIAEGDVAVSTALADRTKLTIESEVRRGYVDLLLARENLALLGRLETLWEQAEAVARSRYEVGNAPQSDLLRAQLERTRLRQERLVLEGDERARLQQLDRAVGRPIGSPIETPHRLAQLEPPKVPELKDAIDDAMARSPEIAAAKAATDQSSERVALAKRDRFPDFAVTAGVMARGPLAPMWQVGLSVGLPVWGATKQWRAVDEQQARAQATGLDEQTVREILHMRTEQRIALLDAVTRRNAVYRGGLLVQSDATTQSTIAQYQVGKVSFASVIEALATYVSDEAGYLSALAETYRLAIAQRELSLEAPAVSSGAFGGGMAPSMGGMSQAGAAGAGMPSTGSMTPGASMSSGSSMSSSGGMSGM